MKLLIVTGVEADLRRAWSMVRPTFFRLLGDYAVVDDFKAIGGEINIRTLQVVVKSGTEYVSSYNSQASHLKVRIVDTVLRDSTVEPMFLIENWRWGKHGIRCTASGLIELVQESRKAWDAHIKANAEKALGDKNV
jgi:hypothetical protein